MSLVAICMRCGVRRSDLTAEWVDARWGGRRLEQIDSGDDFMFPGLIVEPAAQPCPRCNDANASITLVRPDAADDIERYIERHYWRG